MRQFNFLSLVTVPIEMLNSQGRPMGKATGFFYESSDSKLFLITNWHVVTGRDPSRPSYSGTGEIPCTLRAKLHKRQEIKDGQSHIRLSSLVPVDIAVNTEDGNAPKWLEDPTYRNRVDVIGIHMEDRKEMEEECTFSVLNRWNGFEERYNAEVMDDIFVIGYPWGISGSNGAVPLYKRGSIASEPLINFDGLPRLLIDCRTSKGLSGSPVVVAHSGIWHPEGKMSPDSIIGTLHNFLGVYSGRLYDQNELQISEREISEIGIVWKKEVLDSIVNEGVGGMTNDDMST